MKRWIPAIAFLICLSFFFIFFERERGYDIGFKISENSFMDDVKIIQNREGTTKLTLSAEKAIFVTDNDIKLDKLTMTFPERDLTLTAKGGIYNLKKRDLKIDGDINAYTKDYQIIADTILWDSSKNGIISDKKIKIVGKKFIAEGDSLEATADNATLRRNVKAVFYGK